MEYEIRQIDSDTEYHAVGRLRYMVYVKERMLNEKHADHTQQMLKEPADEHAMILAAFDCNRVIGTARINFGDDPSVSEFREFYRMDTIGGSDASKKVIASRLMVDPCHRGSSLTLRLVQAVYTLSLERGADHGFLDANENLFRFYDRLGFVPLLDDVVHPVYGYVRRYVLRLHDEAHFEFVRSPYLPILRAWRQRQALRHEVASE